jgi:1,4-dihydroxy-2-naphthoate octaprenyltransferase
MFVSIQYAFLKAWDFIFKWENLAMAFCSSLFLLGSYPLTQVYQHQEDRKRGDQTISLMLGVKGTFLFSSIAFILGSLALTFLFIKLEYVIKIYYFLGFGLPILAYFSYWYSLVLKNSNQANFKHSMRMNMISSICLSAAFMFMLL